MEVIRNVDNEFMITAHHQNDVWFFFSHQHFDSCKSFEFKQTTSLQFCTCDVMYVWRTTSPLWCLKVVVSRGYTGQGIKSSTMWQVYMCLWCVFMFCSFMFHVSQSNKKQEFKFSQSAWTPYCWSVWQILKYNIHCDNETSLLLVSHLIYTELK